jgi:hypothetical protein
MFRGMPEGSVCIFAMFSARGRSTTTLPSFVVMLRAIPSLVSVIERFVPVSFIGRFCVMDC